MQRQLQALLTLRLTPMETPPARREATFMGIRRADGRVATRNYIGVLTSVNCSATAARAIAEEYFRAETVLEKVLRDLGL